MDGKLFGEVVQGIKAVAGVETFLVLPVAALHLAVMTRCVWLNELVPYLTLFEARLKQLGIKHKLIRPYTPRHNGKVERSHRKDNEYFYATHKFYSFEDFKNQLAIHNKKYNAFPMRPLNWHSPKDYIADFLRDGLLH